MLSAELGWQELLEQGLTSMMDSEVGLLYEASHHIVGAGGKRVRPSLVYLAYMAAGGTDMSHATPVAAAAELIHTASLVHDDLNDQSELRRGAPSVNAVWGGTAALLTGDFLFAKAVKLVAPLGPSIVALFAEACLRLVEGETMQLLTLGDLEMSEATYIEIVTKKTAALFAACTESGAILAAAAADQAQALREYGLNLGIAFQIKDDTLDLEGDECDLGKPVAEDLEQGKLSLALLQGLKASGEALDLLHTREIAQARDVLRATGAFEYASRTADSYAKRAKAALRPLPPSDARDALDNLADFVVARKQ